MLRTGTDPTAGLLIPLAVGASCLAVAALLANTSSLLGLAIVLGLLVAAVSFIWPEVGLYILLLSMLLSPEIIVGGAGGGTTGSRGVTLRMDDFLLLLLAMTWLARAAVYQDIGLFVKTPINRPLVAYLLVAAVSTGAGILFGRVRPVVGTLFVVKFVEYVVVYFAVMNYVRDRAHLKRLVIVAFATALLVSAYGILQIPQGVRVSAPFEGPAGEPNTMGGYLLLILALFGGLLASAPDLRRSVRYALGIVVLGVPFLYTLSRASYLGILIAAPVIILLSRRKIIAAFSVGIFFMGLVLLAPASVVERVDFTLGGQGAYSGQVQVGAIRLDTSTSARIQTTEQILRDFQSQPVLGHGVTGYGFVDGMYQRVLIEMGLLGLGAFLWLLYALLREGWRSYREARDWWEEGLCIGYLAGLLGLMFHALATNTFIIVRIMEPFWFFTGAVSLLYIFNTQGEPEPEEPAEPTVQEQKQGLISPFPYGGGPGG
ncbi:MAG: O-antigen ligase family protein [bacterium]